MFERILYWQKLFAASICRYLRTPCLTPRPKELRLSSTPPVSNHPRAYQPIFFYLLLPSRRPSIFHLHRFNIHQLSSVHLVISPLDWPSVYPSVASRHILPYINLSGLSFPFLSGEELWIGVIKPRPQEWPGGYPGDLGEAIARRRSGWDRRRTREAEEEAAMNASVNVERNSWRLPPDETVQVGDPRSKSTQVKEVNRSTSSPSGPYPVRKFSSTCRGLCDQV